MLKIEGGADPLSNVFIEKELHTFFLIVLRENNNIDPHVMLCVFIEIEVHKFAPTSLKHKW